MNLDYLRVIAEDLELLKNSWTHQYPEPDIRRGSAILRRLLIENQYMNAWKHVGFDKQPTLNAVDLLSLVEGIPESQIIVSLAMGAHYRDTYWAGICLTSNNMRIKTHDSMFNSQSYPGEKTYYLSDYLSSSSGIANSKHITRKDVIKYIANVLGGVHINQKQRKEEQKLIARVEKFHKKIKLQQSDGLLIELTAIAQAIGHSTDCSKLITKIRTLLGKPQGQ
jgi:hypothetical protein